MANPSDLGDIIVAVEANDYAELYGHILAIGGHDEAAVVKNYTTDDAICAFCGETAPLKQFLRDKAEIDHNPNCRFLLIQALLQRLPQPLS